MPNRHAPSTIESIASRSIVNGTNAAAHAADGQLASGERRCPLVPTSPSTRSSGSQLASIAAAVSAWMSGPSAQAWPPYTRRRCGSVLAAPFSRCCRASLPWRLRQLCRARSGAHHDSIKPSTDALAQPPARRAAACPP